MKNKYFIGKEYKTIKEKNDVLDSYDELQKSKIKFLNDIYDNENTLKGMWSVYNNHIHPHELASGKDVMFFNETEVDEIIASRFRLLQPTKNNILHFINIYKRWGIDRGDISGNSVDAINRTQATKDLTKVLINKVWGLGEFYNLMIRIEKESVLAFGIPLLLSRYGITGKQFIEARSLKWEDIDFEKKQVKIICDEHLKRTIDVDDRFLLWLNKYRENPDNPEEYEDYGYVLRKSKREKNDDILANYNTLNSRVQKACKDLKIDRIAFGDLQRSRYIDLLLDIRANRKLTTDDFEWVLLNFKDEAPTSRIIVLREFYESLTNDKVIFKNVKGHVDKETLKDDNAKETAEKIRKTIKYDLYINGEENFEKVESKEVDIIELETSNNN